MSQKELKVSALENGTVLDHIPAENVYKALEILDLKDIESQITIGINLVSKQHGRKGIIKIADRFFEDGTITVFGHTPTMSYSDEYKGKPIFTDTWINIDAGAAYGEKPAVLRLDDLKVFYTED